MKNKYTDEYFIERGYKAYPKTQFDSQLVVQNFQKRFGNEYGNKYFIDIHKYSNEDLPNKYKQEKWYTPFSYEYTCQLYRKDTHDAVNLLFHNSWSIEQVEEFVENMFQSGILDYYERFEE